MSAYRVGAAVIMGGLFCGLASYFVTLNPVTVALSGVVGLLAALVVEPKQKGAKG
jgi:hypothetical protein